MFSSVQLIEHEKSLITSEPDDFILSSFGSSSDFI